MEQEQTNAEQKFEQPSLSAVLDGAQGKEVEPTPVAATPEPEAKPEPEPKADAGAKPADANPAAAAEPKAQDADPEVKQKGLLGAIQSERQKRQEEARLRQAAEAELNELRAQMAQSQAVMHQAPELVQDEGMGKAQEVLHRANMLNLNASERIARLNHSDYDEKLAVFAEVQATDKALFQRVMASDDPGEEAYRAGTRILLERQYGADVIADPVKFREAVLKEASTPKPKANSQAVATETKQPTDISQARAAGGQPNEWKPPTLEEQLAKAVAKPRRG